MAEPNVIDNKITMSPAPAPVKKKQPEMWPAPPDQQSQLTPPTTPPVKPYNPYTDVTQVASEIEAKRQLVNTNSKYVMDTSYLLRISKDKAKSLAQQQLSTTMSMGGAGPMVTPTDVALQAELDWQKTVEPLIDASLTASKTASGVLSAMILMQSTDYATFEEFASGTRPDGKGGLVYNIRPDIKSDQASMEEIKSMFERTTAFRAGLRSGTIHQPVLDNPATVTGQTATELKKDAVHTLWLRPASVKAAISENWTDDNIMTVFGMTRQEVTDARILDLITSSQEQYDMFEALRLGNSQLSPYLTAGEVFQTIVFQPALATAEMVSYYIEYFAKPLTGQIQTGLTLLAGEIDKAGLDKDPAFNTALRVAGSTNPINAYATNLLLDQETQDLGRTMSLDIKTRMDAGESPWDIWFSTSRSLYDVETEAIWGTKQIQWASKLFVVIALDPISYIGMPFTSTGLKSMGAAGRYLASLNTGWIRLTDNAFLAAFEGISHAMPKSAAILADAFTRETTPLMMRAMTKYTGGKEFVNWTGEQIRRMSLEALDTLMRRPWLAGASDSLKWAKSLMIRPHITVDELKAVAKSIGVAADDIAQIGIDHAAYASQIYETVKLVNGGPGVTLNRASDIIAYKLGGVSNAETRKAVSKWLESRLTTDVNSIKGLFNVDKIKGGKLVAGKIVGGTVRTENEIIQDMLLGIRKFQKEGLIANGSGDIANYLNMNSKVERFINWCDNSVLGQAMNEIDHQITMPLARQALWFTNFGPGNAVEAVYRSAFAGFNVLGHMTKGNDIIEISQRLFSNVPNAPAELMAFGRIKIMQQLASEEGRKLIEKEVGTSGLDWLVNHWYGLGKNIPFMKDLPLPFQRVGREPGWMMKVKHLPFSSVASAKTFREHWDQICMRGKASQYFQAYMEGIDIADPVGVAARKAIRASVRDQGFVGFSSRELDQFGETAVVAHVMGPHGYEQLSANSLSMLQSKIIAMRTQEVTARFTRMNPVHANTLIFEMAHNNGAYHPLELAALLGRREEDDFIIAHLSTQTKFKEMADSFEQMDITADGAFDYMMYQMKGYTDAHTDNLDFLTHTVPHFGEGVTDPISRHEAYVSMNKAFMEYVYNTDKHLAKMARFARDGAASLKKLRGGKTASPERIAMIAGRKDAVTKANDALDVYDELVLLGKDTHADDLMILEKYKPVKGVMPWDKINTERTKLWEAAAKQRAVLLQKLDTISSTRPAITLPKVTSKLLPAHVAYVMGVDVPTLKSMLKSPGSGAYKTKSAFVNAVRAKADEVGKTSGMGTGASNGFTDNAIGEAYKVLLESEGGTVGTWLPMMQIKADAIKLGNELMNVKLGTITDPDNLARWNKWVGDMKSKYGAGSITDDMRAAAMAHSQKSVNATFADYSLDNAGNAVMRRLAPYWTYEANRPQWLAKTMIQKPGVTHAFGAYMNNTDAGMVDIPGTEYKFNPVGNGVFSTFRRTYMNDNPEYYGKLEPVQDVIDKAGRVGLYFGAWHPVAKYIGGNREAIASVLPPWASNSIDLALAGVLYAFPVKPGEDPNELQKLVSFVATTVFPDSWRNYNNGVWLKAHGYDSKSIIRKVVAGEALSGPELEAWNDATKHSCIYMFFKQESGSVFNYNPSGDSGLDKEAKREAQLRATEILTGAPVNTQKYIYNHSGITGRDLGDYIHIDPAVRGLLYSLDEINGANLAIMPESVKHARLAIYSQAEDFVKIRDEARVEALTNQTDLETWAASETGFGGVDPKKWISRHQSISGKTSIQYETITKQKYPNLDLSLDDKKTYYTKYGLNLFASDVDELISRYYEIEPATTMIDEDGKEVPWVDKWTGQTGADYDTFYEERQAVLDSLTPDVKAVVIPVLNQHMLPVDKVYQSVRSRYLTPYNATRDALLVEYTPEEQKQIMSYMVAPTDEKEARKKLEIEVDSAPTRTPEQIAQWEKNHPGQTYAEPVTKKKLLTDWDSKLSNIHYNLRLQDPHLDAWLNFFGVVSTFAKTTTSTTVDKTPAQVAQWEKNHPGQKYEAPAANIFNDGSRARAIYKEIRANIAAGNYDPYIWDWQ